MTGAAAERTSALFGYLNAGKRCVGLDLASDAAHTALAALMERHDLVLWAADDAAIAPAQDLVDHAVDGMSGLYSMVGGKLASYRLFAEEATDVVASRLGRSSKSTTHC